MISLHAFSYHGRTFSLLGIHPSLALRCVCAYCKSDLIYGESLLFKRGIPLTPVSWGGVLTESPCPSKQTCKTAGIRALILVFDVSGLLLRGKERVFCHRSIFKQLLMWDNSLLFSNLLSRNSEILWISLFAQPLHSQQPGIYKRGRFPRPSSSGVSVSTGHKFILYLKDKFVSPLMHLLNTFFQVHRKQPNQVDFSKRFPWTENLSASVSIYCALYLLDCKEAFCHLFL